MMSKWSGNGSLSSYFIITPPYPTSDIPVIGQRNTTVCAINLFWIGDSPLSVAIRCAYPSGNDVSLSPSQQRMQAAEVRRRQEEELKKRHLQQIQEDRRMAEELARKRLEQEVHFVYI